MKWFVDHVLLLAGGPLAPLQVELINLSYTGSHPCRSPMNILYTINSLLYSHPVSVDGGVIKSIIERQFRINVFRTAGMESCRCAKNCVVVDTGLNLTELNLDAGNIPGDTNRFQSHFW